jgi:riboflavin kinase/FMN adenylyltransferase
LKICHISYPNRFSIEDFPDGGQVLAIGYFDGVHLGHQEVIRRASKIGEQRSLPVSIMTFHPHPKEVLGHVQNARYLTPLDEKLALLADMAVDHAYIVSFDRSFSMISPERFVQEMLAEMQVRIAVVGFNFTFGYLGRGTVDSLKQLSSGKMDVDVIPPFHLGQDKLSSTMIKQLLHERNIDKANTMLGRYYSIKGVVVSGEGRGRTIGFPTANIAMKAPYVLPSNGVYTVDVTIDSQRHSGVMNIGLKPTFASGGHMPTLEAHIFDFSEQIYGKEITVEFTSFIRQERKFSSAEDLVKQIHMDIDEAKTRMHRNVIDL